MCILRDVNPENDDKMSPFVQLKFDQKYLVHIIFLLEERVQTLEECLSSSKCWFT